MDSMAYNPYVLDRRVSDWLYEKRFEALSVLWQAAGQTCLEVVGSEVHFRGLIEFSNHCRRNCLYCGLRAGNHRIERYRLSAEQIFTCVQTAVRLGMGTVVLQSGEDPDLSLEWMSDLVRRIKQETNLSVTLSLGERSEKELEHWRWAGADRYFMRFETSNLHVYNRLHPPLCGRKPFHRLELLKVIKRLGYETGSGIMVGLPGQTHEDLVRDIELLIRLDLDMIGLGPWLLHPGTPLGRNPGRYCTRFERQVSNLEETTYKVMAIVRLLCPMVNMPATTALTTLNRKTGIELSLTRGANVIMPDLTPMEYRKLYEIYPAKTDACQDDGDFKKLFERLEKLKRRPGTGPGRSMRHACNLKTKECSSQN